MGWRVHNHLNWFVSIQGWTRNIEILDDGYKEDGSSRELELDWCASI
jgi:hypothetical protein